MMRKLNPNNRILESRLMGVETRFPIRIKEPIDRARPKTMSESDSILFFILGIASRSAVPPAGLANAPSSSPSPVACRHFCRGNSEAGAGRRYVAVGEVPSSLLRSVPNVIDDSEY